MVRNIYLLRQEYPVLYDTMPISPISAVVSLYDNRRVNFVMSTLPFKNYNSYQGQFESLTIRVSNNKVST